MHENKAQEGKREHNIICKFRSNKTASVLPLPFQLKAQNKLFSQHSNQP